MDDLKFMNDLKFHIMFKDEPVAYIEIANNNLVKLERYTDINYKQPFSIKSVSLECVKVFLKCRTIKPYRRDIEYILSKLGLEHYDTLDILRKTHGIDIADFTWIKFEGENISWADVNPR